MIKKAAPNMAIATVIIVLIGVGIALFLTRQKTSFPSWAKSPEPNQTPTLAANAEYESSDSGEYYYGPSNDPKASSTPVPSAAPLKSYIYQGAKIVNESATKLEMESTADSSIITNWYKSKIKSGNFNAKSFSQTSTNGVIFNKLSAVKPGEKIDITIKKDQNTSNVLITVDRS